MTQAPTHAPSGTESTQSPTALCMAGRYADALAMLQPVLESREPVAESALVEALNVAAVCSLGLTRLQDAEAYWRRSIDIQPGFVDAYNNLGILLRGLGRLAEAETCFRQVVALRPDLAEAHNNLGAVHYALRRLPEAEAAYQRALAIRADYTEARFNLGIVLFGLRRLHEAESAYRQVMAATPANPEVHNNLGCVLGALGRFAEAEAAYRQTLALQPQHAQAWSNLADALKALNRLPEAELACRQALALKPGFAEAHNILGCILAALKRHAEAEGAYRQALALRPDYAETHYNLGILLFETNRLLEAETAYRDALRIRPGIVEACNNLGNVLQMLERMPEAEAAYRQALTIRPDLAEAHYNLGIVLKAQNRFAEAEAACRQALVVRPGYDDASFLLATLLLSHGQFEEGWRLYESRYQKPEFVHRQSQLLLRCRNWQGEPLAGKSLLVWQEDGLGDMIQFGRYFALLQAQGAGRITFACMPALHRLFTGVDGIDEVLTHDAAQAQSAGYACWTSLLSAPFHLRTTPDNIPRALPLEPEPSLVAQWGERLAALPGNFRIGLVWKGNPKHHNDAYRSLPSLSTLAPLWSLPGVSFVSLQKGQGEDEALSPPASQPLLPLGSEVTDFADTAAIIDQLDLMICVDTSTAHLAASLGKPCWVLLPGRDIDWRWMHERTDSPWYPRTLRLFRQRVDERWEATVERVRQACIDLLSDPGRLAAHHAEATQAPQSSDLTYSD